MRVEAFLFFYCVFVVAPKIDRRNLRDVTLSSGSTLKFDVNVTGEPPPNTEWRFGAIPLRSGRNVTVDGADYNTKLVIRPVKRGDSGEYTVTATNSSGKDSVTVNVTVTDKPGPPEGPLQVRYFFKTEKTNLTNAVMKGASILFRGIRRAQGRLQIKMEETPRRRWVTYRIFSSGQNGSGYGMLGSVRQDYRAQ